jgi:hypothetical protein
MFALKKNNRNGTGGYPTVEDYLTGQNLEPEASLRVR